MSDIKENQLINYYYKKISLNNFDEKDIYSFLILLRQYATSKSPVYEFANFIAHREKDRGYIKDYIETTKKNIEKIGKENVKVVIKSIFTTDDIRKSLNLILEKLDKEPLNNDIVTNIILCIIVLLQDVGLYSKKNKKIGNLVIGINKTNINLMGCINLNNNEKININFPALTIENRYLDLPNYYNDNILNLKNACEVVNCDGKIKLLINEELNYE